MVENPTITCCLICYNQVTYIRQAIESILAQQTQHSFEIVIADDCSTDGTHEIVVEYQKQNPDKIRTVLQEKHVGPHRNLFDLYSASRGDYVAYLEGDDYWTDNNKLEKQLTILLGNSRLVGCAHNVEMRFESEDKAPEKINGPKTLQEASLEDYCAGRAYYHSSSLVWRNIFRGKVPEIFLSKYFGDRFIGMLYLQHGKIWFLDEVMSCYRIHNGGTWSRMNVQERLLANVNLTLFYRKYFDKRYEGIFNTQLKEVCYNVLSSTDDANRDWFLRMKYRLLLKWLRSKSNIGKPIYKVGFYVLKLLDSYTTGKKNWSRV
jgi:glycosyltransferase involved in cell wall biosynthesis